MRSLAFHGRWLPALRAPPLATTLRVLHEPPQDSGRSATKCKREGNVTGIIIIGGLEDGWVTAGRGGLAVNEAAERLTEGVHVARALPNPKVVFTGGVRALFDDAEAGSSVLQYLIDAGVARERILIENAS